MSVTAEIARTSTKRKVVAPKGRLQMKATHLASDKDHIKGLEQLKAAVLETNDSAVQQDATEDSQEDARTEVGNGNEYDYDGNFNDGQEESLDEDTILDFLKSSEVDPKYKAIPPDLVELITQLWKKHSIKCAVIDQNREKWKEILVYGVRADSIKQEINDLLRKFPNFYVKFCEEEVKPRCQHMSRDKVSVIEKRGGIANPDWVDRTVATCGMLVTATATNKDGNRDPVHFAIAPAHMMLTKRQLNEAAEVEHYCNMAPISENIPISFEESAVTEATGDQHVNNEYEDNESTVRDRTRVNVEKNSTKRRYVATWDEGEQHKLVHLNHPALFAYRRRVPVMRHSCLARLIETGSSTASGSADSHNPPAEHDAHSDAVENGASAIPRRKNISQASQAEKLSANHLACPNTADRCITDSKNDLCLHMFLNDIALLHLSYTDACSLKIQLLKKQQPSYCEELLPINTQKVLNNFNSTQHHVVVGDFKGVAWPPPHIEENGNEYGRCLFFTLTSKDAEDTLHSLTDGDCGMIVCIKGDGKCLPVGMFIGAFDFKKFGGNPDNSTDRRTRLYQAIILSQALRNIEVDYPHHLKELGLFKLPSNSATTRLGARSPTSQCD